MIKRNKQPDTSGGDPAKTAHTKKAPPTAAPDAKAVPPQDSYIEPLPLPGTPVAEPEAKVEAAQEEESVAEPVTEAVEEATPAEEATPVEAAATEAPVAEVPAAAEPAPAKKSLFSLGRKKDAAKTVSVTPMPGMKDKKKKIKQQKQRAPGALSYIGLGKEREAFIQNLATLLNAGLPLIDSLQTLALETRPKPMKKLIARMIEAVEGGSPLWRAMAAQHFFTPYALALIRIGEEAGNLARNMEYLAAQQEKDHALKQKVKMAMIYPVIVLVLVFVIVIGLGGFVLPKLIPVLTALNAPLPFTTRVMIQVSDFFTSKGIIAVPAMIATFVGVFLLHTFTRFRVVTQWLTFRIPGIGKLAREATIARFGVILGGLLKAGVPLVEALTSLTEVTWIVCYRNFYKKLTDSVNTGQSFHKSFTAIKNSQALLPVSVQSLVVVGEKSGTLADVLVKISDIYDHKASDTAQKLPIILEPTLLLFMGGLVGLIAFSIIMPIYSVVGNVGT